MNEHVGVLGIAPLATAVLVLLLAPTLVGALVGLAFGWVPIGLALGAAAGVVASSVVVTRAVLDRIEGLAPRGEKEDTPE